jgi:peptidoglycan/LPS O-acetylase OafA/YrhL
MAPPGLGAAAPPVDSLFWGVLVSYLYHFRNRAWLATARRWWPVTLAAAAALASPAWIWTLGFSPPVLPTLGLTTIAWGAVLLLILAIAPRPERSVVPAWRRPLRTFGSALAVIGVDSYSIYLWHMPVVIWVLPALDRRGLFAGMDPTTTYLLRYSIYLTVAVVGGIAAARLVERPLLALRDRLFPSRAAALGRVG